MLARSRIVALKSGDYGPGNGDHNRAYAGEYELRTIIDELLAEIEAQRPLVICALACTGEDGHDAVTDLVCEAEEYREKHDLPEGNGSQARIREHLGGS